MKPIPLRHTVARILAAHCALPEGADHGALANVLFPLVRRSVIETVLATPRDLLAGVLLDTFGYCTSLVGEGSGLLAGVERVVLQHVDRPTRSLEITFRMTSAQGEMRYLFVLEPVVPRSISFVRMGVAPLPMDSAPTDGSQVGLAHPTFPEGTCALGFFTPQGWSVSTDTAFLVLPDVAYTGWYPLACLQEPMHRA